MTHAPDAGAASTYAVSFDAFDAALTSALDAIDGAAGSLFGDDASSASSWDDETSKLAVAWRACALNDAQERMRTVRARVTDAKARDVEAKRALKETLVNSKMHSKDAVVDALTEEVRRLQAERDAAVRDVMSVCDSPLAVIDDPSAVLESIAAVRRELSTTRVERDAAKARALKEGVARDATDIEAKMKAQIESALKGMEAKKRAAEQAADAAREGQAKASNELRVLERRYDDAMTRIFELETESETAIARVKIERDELVKLEEEIKEREDALDAADERRRAEAMDASSASDAQNASALREKLAVKERMVVQLATTIEEAEKNAEESKNRAKKELDDANQRVASLCEELAAVKDAASASGLAEREEIVRLKVRVKMLQELSGVGDDVDSADIGDENTVNVEAMRALRENNKKLTAEVVVATREKEEATATAALARAAQEAAENRYTETAQMVSTLEMDLSRKLASVIEAGGHEANADLLTILTSQRDRFKRRASELDERAARLEQERIVAEDAKHKLQNDNVALVEKLTFVQNYYSKQTPNGKTTILRVDEAGIPVSSTSASIDTDAAQSQSAKQHRYSCGGGISVNVEGERSTAIADGIRRRAARYGCFGGPSGAGDDEIPGGDSSGIISRYRKKYLARLNPFNAFRANASDDSTSLLPIHDRIALGSGKMLMTSRTTRTLFSSYIILLHVYLFTRAFR